MPADRAPAPGRRFGPAAAALLAAALAAGCQSAVAVKELSDAELGNIAIAAITIEYGPDQATPEIDAALRAALERNLRPCAKGTVQRDLVVRVGRYVDRTGRTPGGPGSQPVWSAADRPTLSGAIYIFTPGRTSMTGEYAIEWTTPSGSPFGLPINGWTAEDMADGFTRTACNKIFAPRERGWFAGWF